MQGYLKVTKTGPQAYSLTQLRRDNPQVSFPDQIRADLLAGFGIYEYSQQKRPNVDPALHVAVPAGFAEIDGKWQLTWAVRDLTPDEKRRFAHAQETERRAAYAEHADPVFFKWQRGEASEGDWLAAVAMVKEWFPDAHTP